eukprot:m.405645 g.405645  ORF g.405645 m.405645 type:complete len:526 (-) comp16795_c3_seq14:70-1647(-)
MYVRECIPELLELFKSPATHAFTRHKTTIVTGAPGTGKSHLCLMYAVQQALSGSHVTFAEVRGAHMYLTEMHGKTWTQFLAKNRDDFCAIVQTAIANKQCVILDGVRNTDDRDIIQLGTDLLLTGTPECMLCTSKQLRVREFGGRTYEPPSWTLDEHIAAAKAGDAFFSTTTAGEEYLKAQQAVEDGSDAEVTPESFVREKFVIAGGSARFMYDYPRHSVIDILNKALREIDNDVKMKILNGGVLPDSESTRNVLCLCLCNTDEKGHWKYHPERVRRSFVSKYVLVHLQNVLNLNDIVGLALRCKMMNQAMFGHAFEELLLRVFSCSEVNLKGFAYGTQDEVNIRMPPTVMTVFNHKQMAFDGTRVALRSVDPVTKSSHPIVKMKGTRIILRPDDTAYPTLDSALLETEDGTIWKLATHQFTVANKHVVDEWYLWCFFLLCRSTLQLISENMNPPPNWTLSSEVHHIVIVDEQKKVPEFRFSPHYSIRGDRGPGSGDLKKDFKENLKLSVVALDRPLESLSSPDP